MGIHGLVQPVPELQNKLGFSIGCNPHGYSMETDYPRTIQPCYLRSSIDRLDRYEVSYLGQSVHNYPKGIISRLSPRQSHDEIHDNLFPLPLGYTQGLKQSNGSFMLCLLSSRCYKRQHTQQHLSSFCTTNRLPCDHGTSYSFLDEWNKHTREPFKVSYTLTP
jgi:hypothetical protein